ncbi:aldo/keto reductase [filamentous cyanobacterium LEGE 11480]|uniref:Aldo/keto reductase n=1 Tax=Romeriopsis navalis LEGE 11480 TaxID=2777977 RepID=A0A928Z4K9_9CYAN|nr:aldo/keto reductase [Romeriopsis navalis]MBE9031879.1 aldo/keto reductase [Romeriopsis navalis LEGE 11480]
MTTASAPTIAINGVELPPLGIGTWAWGDSLFWSYGKDYGEPQLETAFKAAIDAGITLFDTAEVYGLGESERILGRMLKTTDQPIYVATKYMPVPWRWGAGAVREALDKSLDRLGIDKIDLYQIHQPFSFLISQTTLLNTLADAVEQGKIGAIGVSNYSAQQMRSAHATLAQRGIPLAVNQVQYSLLARQIERNGVLETAQELGVTILAYSPLAQGLLTGKYNSETVRDAVSGARKLDPRFTQRGLEKISPVVQLLTQIGENYNRAPTQVALNWLICQGVLPIPGAKSSDQAQQNAGALGWSMNREELMKLDLLTRSWQ